MTRYATRLTSAPEAWFAQGVFDSNHDQVNADRYRCNSAYRNGVQSTLTR